MQCHNCGTQLSPGIQFCPNCGTAAPDNVAQPAPIDPTVVASPYQPSPIPPTSYGAPPPPSSNPPVPDPYAGYNNTPPAYNTPGQQPPYGYNPTPPPPAPNSYQQYAPVPNYNPAQPFPMPPTAPPRKSRTGLIIGITAAVLVVIVIGLCAIVPKLASKTTTPDSTPTTQNSNTPIVESTPTPTPVPTTNSSTTPSGNIIDSTAASIVTDAQTASSVDSVSAAPTNVTSTFKTSTDIYVTFKLNTSAFNFSQNTGYVAVKYYADSTALSLPNNNPLTINQPAPGGFFKVQYFVTAQGAAELYWCQVSDCSDEKLAQVVTFTVTS